MKPFLAFLAGAALALGATVLAPTTPAVLRTALGLAPAIQAVAPAQAGQPARE